MFRKIKKKILNHLLKKECNIEYKNYNNNNNINLQNIPNIVNSNILGYRSLDILLFLLKNKNYNVLDIGCGKDQIHSNIMKQNLIQTLTCDFFDNCDYKGFYENINFEENKFDCIWCNHVLEHVLNIDLFLKKIKHDIKEEGLLFITVPPLKHNIVGGHVNLFNSGLLLYRLILAGFDCSQCIVLSYQYNISVILKVKKIQLPNLFYDIGDIELLSKFFPFDAKQNFNGFDLNINTLI